MNTDRKPTAIDRKILEWLKSGQSINHLTALSKFKTTMLRDSIWRLIKDGEPIQSKWHYYETSDGSKKKFKIYFITPPEILAAGHTTEKAMKGENVADISRKIQKVSQNVPVQVALF